jgi:hypothetical protein
MLLYITVVLINWHDLPLFLRQHHIIRQQVGTFCSPVPPFEIFTEAPHIKAATGCCFLLAVTIRLYIQISSTYLYDSRWPLSIGQTAEVCVNIVNAYLQVQEGGCSLKTSRMCCWNPYSVNMLGVRSCPWGQKCMRQNRLHKNRPGPSGLPGRQENSREN